MTQAGSIELFEGVKPSRIAFDEYVAMIGAGVFGDARVELVDGELIGLAPSETRHSRVLDQVFASLHNAYAQTSVELYIDAIAKLGFKQRVHRFAEPSGKDFAWTEVSNFGETLTLPEVGSTIVIG